MIDFGDSLIEGNQSRSEQGSSGSSHISDDHIEQFSPNSDPEDGENLIYVKGNQYSGTFVGTPLYVAPEMLQHSISGHFTDLWGLGCIIYEMETGEAPFRGKTDQDTFE